MEVPTSGYRACQQTHQQVVTQLELAWETVLVKVFGVYKHLYGTHQLRVELRRQGYRVGRPCRRTAMRRQGLQPKAFTPCTTDSTHGLRCAPNRLLTWPKPTQANRAWVSDSTYLPLVNGDWAYVPLSGYGQQTHGRLAGRGYDN